MKEGLVHSVHRGGRARWGGPCQRGHGSWFLKEPERVAGEEGKAIPGGRKRRCKGREV